MFKRPDLSELSSIKMTLSRRPIQHTMNNMPDLCIHLVLEKLCVTGLQRSACHVVKDCLSLAATSRGTRHTFAVPLADILDPPNNYELLTTKACGPVRLTQLRLACCSNRLRIGGNHKTLLERLRVELEDMRLPICGMGKRFCERAQKEYARAQLLLSLKEKACACAARREVLEGRMRERGCLLRIDSEVSRAYINQTTHALSLDATVDCAEQMRFFHVQTDYHRILRGVRGQPCSFIEEGCRRAAKAEALKRWMIRHAQPDMSHLQKLPLSLR